MIQWKEGKFHPTIVLPGNYEVLDFTQAPATASRSLYTIGRYNERRLGLYTQAIFQGERNHHVGIDIGAPAGTPVYAFYEGSIFLFQDNYKEGDYGPTIVTRHEIGGQVLFALYGHLSRASLVGKHMGQKLRRGEQLGSLGEVSENGGWPPHVHFQLSYEAPLTADMPGTVREDEVEDALLRFPDPRMILGPIY